MDFENSDYVKLAESFGWRGARVTCAPDLPTMLERAFISGDKTLIDCPVDHSETVRVFTDELQNIVCPI